VTSKGTLTLRKKELLPGGRLELHAERATAEISGFIGLLAGRHGKTASLEQLTDAAAAGWAVQ
jgi:antitoxin PrlF